MRYLVTGGAGFIGSHLVEYFLGQGHEVTVLDDFSTGKRDNLRPFLDRVTLVQGSVAEPRDCARAAEGVDFVLHQAALPSVPRSIVNPADTHEVCATGTLNVLIAAREAGVRRVVYAASSSAYGNTEELPKVEHMPPRPRSPYAVAKLAGEHYCQAFHAAYALETVALRYFNIYGPRQDPTSQYGAAVPKFITAALAGESPTIFGDGGQTRDFTYVANAVHANVLACSAPPEACGKTFNVGCGERISINELWGRVRELTESNAAAVYAPGRAGDVRDSLASLELAGRFLGYEPVVGLEEGLAATIASFSPAAGSSKSGVA